jgi:hypothetical protein
MTKAIFGTFIVTIIIIAGLIYMAGRPKQVNLMGDEIPDLGREHIGRGENHPEYNSNPPSSGWHYAEPASWGFYDRELEDEQVVHNLEHGAVWITFKPDIDQATKDAIKRLVERYSSKVIATARSKNDTPLALVSWGRVMKMESFDKDQALEFVKRNRNHGPEQVPD